MSALLVSVRGSASRPDTKNITRPILECQPFFWVFFPPACSCWSRYVFHALSRCAVGSGNSHSATTSTARDNRPGRFLSGDPSSPIIGLPVHSVTDPAAGHTPGRQTLLTRITTGPRPAATVPCPPGARRRPSGPSRSASTPPDPNTRPSTRCAPSAAPATPGARTPPTVAATRA